jgi:hypothetical protein
MAKPRSRGGRPKPNYPTIAEPFRLVKYYIIHPYIYIQIYNYIQIYIYTNQLKQLNIFFGGVSKIGNGCGNSNPGVLPNATPGNQK